MYERDRSKLLRRVDTAASWALDAAVALITLPITVGIVGHDRKPGSNGELAQVLGASVLSVLPLLVRRRWPVQVLAFILIVSVAVPGPAVFSPPALVALYTVASRRPWRVAALGGVATATTFVVHRPIWGYNLSLFEVIAELALVGCAVALGLYRATRVAYVEQVHERATRLERERELLIEQAATEERLRIARELHDVVAHNVSLMVVQAQALGADADKAEVVRRGARSIAELGRGAMSEMHRTLELMRPDRADGQRSPQPRLTDLVDLLGQAHQAGVSTELAVRGEPRPLPAGVELSAYRIVQESLTNVIKHAGRAHTKVRVAYRDDALEIEIVDDGQGAAGSPPPSTGHGLLGMRERAALFGGTLSAGPVNGNGYRVRATLPYGDER